jgi:F420-dependent oxidoreductase-like protein
VHEGRTVTIPLPADQGTGLGKPLKLIETPLRPTVPIWWAAMLDRSVQSAAAVADGWLPLMFVPEAARVVWGAALDAGAAERDTALGALDLIAGGKLAIGDDLPDDELLDAARPALALYIGGMGARGKNFYNDIISRAGYPDAAREIQDLYLDGKKDEAAAAVPRELLERMHLIGSAAQVAERVAAYREAGVTTLVVEPVGPDPIGSIRQLRELLG